MFWIERGRESVSVERGRESVDRLESSRFFSIFFLSRSLSLETHHEPLGIQKGQEEDAYRRVPREERRERRLCGANARVFFFENERGIGKSIGGECRVFFLFHSLFRSPFGKRQMLVLDASACSENLWRSLSAKEEKEKIRAILTLTAAAV